MPSSSPPVVGHPARRLSSLPPPLVGEPHREPPRRTSWLTRVAIRVGVVLLVGALFGRCALGVVDRPSLMSLATTTRGASLRDATRVVVVLHGYGASMRDLARLAPEVAALGAPERTAFVHVDAPLSLGAGRAWWRTTNPAERAESARRVSALVDDLLAETGLPPDRVYLVGFSQGAALALDLALARPGTLGGVVALSPCTERIDWAALASRPPVRGAIVHGRSDRICRFDGSASLAAMLAERGHAIELVGFDGDHEITRDGEAALVRLLTGP